MRNWQKLTLTSFLLFILASCTKVPLELNRYVEPELVSDSDSITIEVFATNQLSGKLTARDHGIAALKDANLEFGGAQLLLAYRQISEQRNPNKNLWIDSGGVFDPLGDKIHLSETQHFVSRMKYDALAFTEKELAAINPQIKSELTAPFVNSHIIDLSSGKFFSNDAIKPWRIIEKAGIKIGVVAVTDYLNVKQLAPEKMRGLYFEDMVLGVLRAKAEFEKNKVNAIVLVAQIETLCKKTKEIELQCPNNDDALKKLILRLPPNTIDLVIASPNLLASGTINKIPVVMAPAYGSWLSRAKFVFNKEQKNLNSVHTLPALRICNKFFHETGDCHIPFDYEQSKDKRMDLIKQSISAIRPAKFWGYEIQKDDQILNELKTIRTQGNQSQVSTPE